MVGAAMAPGAPEVGAEVGAEVEGGTAEAPAGELVRGELVAASSGLHDAGRPVGSHVLRVCEMTSRLHLLWLYWLWLYLLWLY
eukprot:scaffold49300_cov52-Phaeocystis_antarctica.AAC.3